MSSPTGSGEEHDLGDAVRELRRAVENLSGRLDRLQASALSVGDRADLEGVPALLDALEASIRRLLESRSNVSGESRTEVGGVAPSSYPDDFSDDAVGDVGGSGGERNWGDSIGGEGGEKPW